jgi:TPR repeat protein
MRILALLFLALSAVPAWSTPADMQRAITESERRIGAGDFAGGLSVLQPYDDSQDASVEYALAFAHMQAATAVGNGRVDADGIARAIRYAERSASHGNAAAYNLLYLIHINGIGVPEDPGRALDYMIKGAEGGDAGAKLNYMHALYAGSALVPRDRAKACPLAFELLEEEQVREIAAHTVGLILLRGECGRAVDKEAAVKMFRTAAEKGVADAEHDLALALEQGVGVAADPVEALSWYAKAAEDGNARANWRMGIASVNGEGRPRDVARAIQYFQRAADGGDGSGMTSLAVMYATGDGVPQDYAKALGLYEEAARRGQPHALRGLAVMYMLGEGVQVDPVRALVLYKQAVALGNPEEPRLDGELRAALTPAQIADAERRFAAWKDERDAR